MATIIILAILFFSITLHEIAHGYVASLFGDNTAKLRGRLTLNPLKHVDPFGTVLLPLLLYFSGAPVIGWAKPVPINPARFTDPKKNMMWVALAGPLTNFSIALLLALIKNFAPINELFRAILFQAIFINLILGTFNLIPVPPLDGSRVVAKFLKGGAAINYAKIEPYGILVILLLAYLGLLKYILIMFMPFYNLFLQ